MEFKEIRKRGRGNRLQVDQIYETTAAEVARARVGLKMAGIEGMPVPIYMNLEACDVAGARAIVAGNLALLQSITLSPLPKGLHDAFKTVETGISALESGERAEVAAKLEFDSIRDTGRSQRAS